MWHPRGEMSIPHGCKCNCHNGIIFNDQHTSPYQTCFYWLNKISWYRDLTRNFVNIYHSKLLVVVWIYPKNYLSYYFFFLAIDMLFFAKPIWQPRAEHLVRSDPTLSMWGRTPPRVPLLLFILFLYSTKISYT
jgi:hypothetical protein